MSTAQPSNLEIPYANGTPLLTPGKSSGTGECLLERTSELIRGGDKLITDEDSLQILLDNYPTLLPVSDFWHDSKLVSLGREIRVATGSIDNLYLTEYGKLVLVETKLYRNSQARREVVAQAIDYAVALSKLSFDNFELALKAAKKSHLNKQTGLQKFYETRVSRDPKMQIAFHDRLSAALRDGDFLILIVGDGIQSSAADLTEVLSRHPTLRYQLGIVRISEFAGDGHKLLVPSVVMKTDVVTRSIIKLVRTSSGVNFHTQSAEEERRELFESFLLTIPDITNAGKRFAYELFEAVEKDPNLSNTFSKQYWYVYYGKEKLFTNTNSKKGSISINTEITRIQGKDLDTARWYTDELLALSSEVKPHASKLGIKEHIAYDLLATRFEQFMNILQGLVTRLPNPDGSPPEATVDEAEAEQD